MENEQNVKDSAESIRLLFPQDDHDRRDTQESSRELPNEDPENEESHEAVSANVNSSELRPILREADPIQESLNATTENMLNSFLSFLDKTGNNFSLVKLYKWLDESEVELPVLLVYCQHAVIDLKLTKSLQSRVIAVLLHFEMHPEDPESQPVMEAILGPMLQELIHKMTISANMKPGLDAVVELIYEVCCNVPIERGISRLAVWVTEQAFSERNKMEPAEMEYMRAFSASLWSLRSLEQAGKGVDLARIITPNLLSHLYNWSTKIGPGAERRRLNYIVDFMICSVCYCRPWLVVYLMYLMGLLKIKEGIDLNGHILTDWLEKWCNEGSIWRKVDSSKLRSSKGDLDLGGLHILRAATLSPPALNILKESRLMDTFNSAILGFCNASPIERRLQMESIITTIQLVQILNFYAKMCLLKDNIRIWLGAGQGSTIWLPVFKLLSTQSADIPRDLANEIEFAVIECLQNLCWVHAHPENLEKIAHYIRELIREENKISPFCKSLLISLFLDDEKIFVRVQSKAKVSLKEPYNSSESLFEDLLPSLGVKGMDRVFSVKMDTTIMEMIHDPTNLSLRLTSCPDIEIPLDFTMKKLLAVERCHSKAGQPFLDMLELTLLEEEPPKQSNRNAPTGCYLPAPLEVFARDCGLLELFQLLNPPAPLDKTIASLLHYLNLPLYLEVFLGESFNYRANCLIRRAMGLQVDAKDNDITNPNISNQLASLPFDVREKLMQMFPSASFTETGQVLRRKIRNDKVFHSSGGSVRQ